MQRINAKDDAVEGGENGERPPSSQPIAPAAGLSPPQPAGKSIPKSPRRGAGILRGGEKRWRQRADERRLSKAMRHVYREIRDSGLLKIITGADDVLRAKMRSVSADKPVERCMGAKPAGLHLDRTDLDSLANQEINLHRVLRRLLIASRKEENCNLNLSR